MIIALTGYKQSGKTEAAKFFQKFGYQKINFKDSLIEEIKQNFPDLLQVIGDDFTNKPPAVRALLQNYGTEVRRRDNINYWVIKWLDKVTADMDATGRIDYVVDDCRFLNEAKAVRDLQGIIIRIIRPGFTGDKHQSEREMDNIKVDYTIIADNLKSLNKQLSEIYARNQETAL